MIDPLSAKQMKFICESTAHWNLAHGSVRSGKTVGTLFRFMQACYQCPDSQIFMVGHSSDTIYQNAIRLLMESEQLAAFRPFCTWFAGKRQLKFMDKTISTIGAKDEGAIGQFQGKTMSLVYCDEMTLYPESIIDMIDTRLSNPHSMGFASMNPSHPNHKLKQWIDKAEAGDPNYYALHFTLDDNPYVDDAYKQRIRDSLSGLFYKRNYLGLWCLAEGAVFDFFDRKIHVVKRPPRAAEYWIAGIDYGTSNNFACTLMGVNSGHTTQTGVCRWFEKEYVWDSHKKGRQKTNSEYADDVQEFLEPYGVRAVYVDPSAAAFKLELRRRGMHVIDADNDVLNGISYMTSEMAKGSVFVCEDCPNLIREIESYVWDSKAAEKGDDKPMKKDDHCFCAGTFVHTEFGLKSIEDIQIGDKVYTRKGLRAVLRTGNNIKKVSTFNLYGKEIRCTPDHKFLTEKGWIEISRLIQSDILFTIENLWENTEYAKRLSLMDTNTDGIQNLLASMRGITTLGMEDIYIEMYGNSTMGKYPMDTIFITKTGTPLTMIYRICNVYHRSSISVFMNAILGQTNLQKKLEKLLQDGINHPKVENGIENMLETVDLENGNHKNLIVNNVEQSTPPHLDQNTDFVRITVSQNGVDTLELIMSKELAKSVAAYSYITDFAHRDFAVPLAEQKTCGKEEVYNLSVEEQPEFFSEGLLVHNSIDSSRYCFYTHKVAPYSPYKHNPNDYRQNRFGGFR